MHALLPWPYVEHTHADSILAITNTVHGERIAAELFGDLAPLVPFHPSGFALAKACDTVYRTQAGPRTIGLILLHHGVVAFGCNARESYEHMLALVPVQRPTCNARRGTCRAIRAVSIGHRHHRTPASRALQVAGFRC